jgi:hypothetical protein
MSVLTRATWCHILEEGILQSVVSIALVLNSGDLEWTVQLYAIRDTVTDFSAVIVQIVKSILSENKYLLIFSIEITLT